MEEQHLPSHHQIYTALIPPSPPPTLSTTSDDTISNNLDATEPTDYDSSSWRQQLLTLHVIFPSLLLPALDLLDHGLVTRLLVARAPQNTSGEASPSHEDEPTEEQEQAASHIPVSKQEADGKDQICMYTVQSVASTSSRRKRHMQQQQQQASTKTYTVHLDAWSCSCAGFALDAYSNHDVTSDAEQVPGFAPPGWAGSLGLDRRLELQADFPCCKHLLACLLADKWREHRRSHVEDRFRTKEELAAIIGSS